MKVTKSNLNFLNRFVEVSDTKAPLHDKVNIEVQGKIAHFSLQTDSVVVTTQIEVDEGNEFSVFLPVRSLNALIRTLPDDADIEIEQNTIKFHGASYTLEATEGAIPLLKQIQKYKAETGETIVFTNLKQFGIVEGFTGADDSAIGAYWESIVAVSEKYIASNRFAMAVVKTENESDKRVNFPRTVARLFAGLDAESIPVTFYDNKWMSFTVDDVLYFVPEKRSSIPDPETWYDNLKLPVNVKIKKSILKPVLARLSLVVSDKAQRAMSVHCKNGKAIFGSVRYNISSEEVEAEYQSEMEDQRVVVSFNYFNSMYNALVGDYIRIGIPTGEAIKRNIFITDEKETLEGVIAIFDDSKISD